MRRLALFLTLGCFACGGGGGGEQGGGAGGEAAGGAAAGAAAAPLGTGSITGTVNFTGTVPENPVIDMAEEPTCRAKYPDAPRDPQVVVTGGKLANVFVYVKSGLPAGATFPMPSQPVVIDQDGCLYHPRVLGVMVGQTLEIRNSDSLSHNIKAVPTNQRGFNVSQPRAGMTTTRTFNTPEIMVPLECNIHGWMQAWLGVVANPYFATSGGDGSFTISGLPDGTYELEAWHEKFGTRTATVTVSGGGAATVEFTFAAQ